MYNHKLRMRTLANAFLFVMLVFGVSSRAFAMDYIHVDTHHVTVIPDEFPPMG